MTHVCDEEDFVSEDDTMDAEHGSDEETILYSGGDNQRFMKSVENFNVGLISVVIKLTFLKLCMIPGCYHNWALPAHTRIGYL